MAILFHCPWPNKALWLRLLRAELPDEEFRVYPELGAAGDIDIAMVWKLPDGALSACRNLRAVLSLGAGVDHLLGNPDIAPGTLVGRLPDPFLPIRMAEYVLAQILNRQLALPDYGLAQNRGAWSWFPRRDRADTVVAVLGLGQLGGLTARQLADFGFQVRGWSRSQKQLSGVQCFAGSAGWRPAIDGADHVVCLLPLTPATEDLVNADFLSRLKPTAHFMNCARGAHVVDADLLAALDRELLAWATLDVFREEPLPQNHPFWRHPRITLTPHISSPSEPLSCVALLTEQTQALRAGISMPNQVDLNRGY